MVLPSSMSGSSLEIYAEGALSVSTWWFNGVKVLGPVYNGYIPKVLDISASGAPINWGGANVLAVYVDGTEVSGWWYEGSGLMRKVWLTSRYPVHIATHGVWSPAFTEGVIHARDSPAAGLYADQGWVNAAAEVTNSGTASADATVSFQLIAADGVTVAATSTITATVNASETVKVASKPLSVANVELWSIPRPYLYTLSVTVSVGGQPVGSTNTTVGVRDINWDPANGLKLNGQATKMRGFCNHESFAGVGSAIPDRVDLLRVQQMRGVGGNAWRTSHNPPEPILLDLADRLGIAVLDENRVRASGDYNLEWVSHVAREHVNRATGVSTSGSSSSQDSDCTPRFHSTHRRCSPPM